MVEKEYMARNNSVSIFKSFCKTNTIRHSIEIVGEDVHSLLQHYMYEFSIYWWTGSNIEKSSCFVRNYELKDIGPIDMVNGNSWTVSFKWMYLSDVKPDSSTYIDGR